MFYYRSYNGYSRCSGASLGLTVTNYTYTDQVGFVHDGTEGDAEGVTEFTTFVDGTRGLGIDVTVCAVRHKPSAVNHVTYLGKPPGALNALMRAERPSLSREYLG